MAQNSVTYPSPVDDPFFSAHQQTKDEYAAPGQVFYYADDLVTVIACIDQGEIRDPNTKRATIPSGFQRLSNLTTTIGLNPRQLGTSWRFIVPSEKAMLWDSVTNFQGGALNAAELLVRNTNEDGLPSNQWQIELQGWFDTALARIQAAVIEFVSKDIDGLEPYAKLMVNPDEEWQCDAQKIKAVGNYQSFSLMGIEIICAVGAFIVLLSFVLEGIVGFFQKRWGRQGYKEALWSTDAILQQQRLAFEHGQMDEWERTDETVPVTQKGKVWSSTPSNK
jgi:hypothetical protein